MRVAANHDAIYLGLADANWRAVEITAAGSRVTDRTPVTFRRAARMLPRREPVPGGRIDELRTLLNVENDTAHRDPPVSGEDGRSVPSSNATRSSFSGAGP